MTRDEKKTLTDFFKQTINESDSMLIISMKDGGIVYAQAASPIEVSYMTDVIKANCMLGQLKTPKNPH